MTLTPKTITAIVAVILISTFSAIGFGMYFSYNNSDARLRNLAEAQRGNLENVYDKMWKILQQKAQVSDQYRDAFKEIYPKLIEGRYSQGDGTLMKWIQESNPQFDVSLYKDLMNSIEVERTVFSNEQKKMLDIIREHNNLIKTVPGKWLVNNLTEIAYTVISSTRSKAVMESGTDDDINLFK